MDMDMNNMDMDMDRLSTPSPYPTPPHPTTPHHTQPPPHPTPSHPTPPPWRAAERAQTVVCGRTHARHCGSRRNAITDHRNPTQEECASGQEQMCSGSRDQHSTGG